MRIPRSPVSKSSTQELARAASGAITPAEAARTQIAKYGAISSGAGSVGEAFQTVGEVRKRVQQADERIKYQTNENNLTAAYAMLKNDPNLKKDIQDDGTETADYFDREVEALLKTYRKGLEVIKDPEIRKQAEALSRGREQLFRAEAEGDSGTIAVRVAAGNLYTGITSALDVGNIEGAKALVDQGYEEGLIDVKGKQTWLDEIEKTSIGIAADGYTGQVDVAYSESEEAGDAALSALISDTSIPKSVRDKAIVAAEKRASQWHKARSQEREQQEVDAIIAFGDDSSRAKIGELSTTEIDAAYESGKYGDGTGAASRRNQLYAMVEQGIKAKEAKYDVGEKIRNGQFINNDKKDRDALSDFENTAIENMNTEEAFATIADISRIAGTVSTQTSRALNLAAVSDVAAAQVLPLYRELTSDEGLHPDMHLSKDAAVFLEHASSLMDVGVPQAEAITVALGSRQVSDTEKIDRGIKWKDEGVQLAQDSFDDLIDSEWYEEPGWFREIDEPPSLMNVEYGKIYKDTFLQTGDTVAAKNLADQTIKRTWVKTNFNSPNPKDFTVQKYGMPGDTQHVRKSVITELEDVTFRIRQPDGAYKNQKVDPDKITFETFSDKSSAYDAEGNQRFRVLHDGLPLSRATEDGPEVATIVVDKNKLNEFTKSSAERDQMEQRLKDIEKEESRLNNLTQNNPYATTYPKLTTSRKDRLKALKKEKKKLTESIPKMDVHF